MEEAKEIRSSREEPQRSIKKLRLKEQHKETENVIKSREREPREAGGRGGDSSFILGRINLLIHHHCCLGFFVGHCSSPSDPYSAPQGDNGIPSYLKIMNSRAFLFLF